MCPPPFPPPSLSSVTLSHPPICSPSLSLTLPPPLSSACVLLPFRLSAKRASEALMCSITPSFTNSSAACVCNVCMRAARFALRLAAAHPWRPPAGPGVSTRKVPQCAGGGIGPHHPEKLAPHHWEGGTIERPPMRSPTGPSEGPVWSARVGCKQQGQRPWQRVAAPPPVQNTKTEQPCHAPC